MYQRVIEQQLVKLAQQYPVVTVLGPRQSGKSTLACHAFPELHYTNLEDPEVRHLAKVDPRRFLNQYPQGVIIDEIQNIPELLSYIQVIVDESQQSGQFILTGSHQLALHDAISQSLAGRTALLTLLPLSLAEIKLAGFKPGLDNQLLTGCYPRIYAKKLEPNQYYRDYYHTYVQRDLRTMINVKDLMQFEKFMRLCAGRIGNVFEASSLANEVGVSSHTIKNWLSILEASYITFRLPPYFENFGKRIIKSPKIYFYDTGLACYLLGIEDITPLSHSPFRGALFENLIILELMKHRYNQGRDHNLYYYRDNNSNEVDIIYKYANYLLPIEIKSAETFNMQFLKGLKYFSKIAGDRIPFGCMIYTGQQQQQIHDFELLNYQFLDKFWQRLDELK